MMERGQLVADGEGSDANSIMSEEADASREKGDGGGKSPGKASLNHGAKENASKKDSEGKAHIVQSIVHQPLWRGENSANNGTGSQD